MTSLDSVKQPVQLQSQLRSTGTRQLRVNEPADQRQEMSESGNSLPASEPPQAKEADRETQMRELAEASQTIASFVQRVSRELRFSVDEDLGRTVVTVVDQNTEQVIRQIPAEEALAMARYLSEDSLAGIQGVLVTEKA